ncbi:MAG: AAA family ATPase [Geminicoccaceae bacterium]
MAEIAGNLIVLYLFRASVTGFRNEAKLDCRFAIDVNFIIGRNGTGKTTFINLLNAALTADLSTLRRTPFKSIKLYLGSSPRSRKATITITKTAIESAKERRSPAYNLHYALRGISGDPFETQFREFDETVYNRRRLSALGRPFPGEDPASFIQLREQLGQLTKNSWLSIHRTDTETRYDRDREFESTIDQKLSTILRNFTTYFSTLDKRAASEIEKFQHRVFLSFLFQPGRAQRAWDVNQLKLSEEKEALERIFQRFKIKHSDYAPRLDRHFVNLQKAIGVDSTRGTDIDDFLIRFDTIRVHEMVQEWQKLTDNLNHVYAPKSTFLSIINSMFNGKSVSATDGNEITVTLRDKRVISAFDLSSGEKQLFIILGETLLQQQETCIFMADEPELSLHVEWQAELVKIYDG